MRRINTYLMRAVIGGSLVALLLLTLLDWVFAFLAEIDSVGHGHYGLAQAILFTLYTEPQRMYTLFPTAVLIGSLLSLGNLAAHSELIAIRAVGVSVAGVVRAALMAGIIMIVVALPFGEWVGPEAARMGQALKVAAESGQQVVREGSDIWARDGDRYIHIDHALPGRRLMGISVYTISPVGHLRLALHAASARYGDKAWMLHDVQKSVFDDPERVQVEQLMTMKTPALISPRLFDLLDTQPGEMTLPALAQYVGYLKRNHLDASRYELSFWQRFTTPLSALVMLMLAIPFVFGSQRSGGAGQRLFIGIVVGVGFYFLNRLSNQVGLVFGLAPLLSAMLPLGLFLFVSLFALRRLR
ncbi:LPS export ABC transporter permease LptG [Acidihalobacter yilgarnensis]|uniref:LPS export ABC transporter permease LptG n=1 Tax=Acidihalobacter yilgarnensis TaxID=2819280 RepID=A0A1D8IT76_9GAMM|nr:LPS export ABC transporter permease LptG [Acidihalobacter yilgarnensis]AOU99676.1 LPS export ABC transporter permease LptG [Acidihalobacter yilgarnensis]